jgi:hypothetical protein
MIQKTFKHDIVNLENQLLSEENDGKRFYVTPKGKYPSVTTVTGWEKSKFFAEWRKNNPEESARTIRRGGKFHSLIEKYLNNEILDKSKIDLLTLDLFLQIKNEIDNIDNIKAMETALYSDLLGLAGRVDCIAEYKQKLSVIDFKGSTKPKRVEDIDNYFMQATAYSIMWQELTKQRIDNIVIMISCEDGKVQVFQEKPINYVKALKNAVDVYNEENNAKV